MFANMLTRILLVAAGSLALSLAYFIVKLVRHRSFYRGLPGPPHSFLWGHLRVMGEMYAKMPPRTYIHPAIMEVHRKYNLPDVWYLDIWPFGPPMLITCGPEATAIATTANVYPQASIVGEWFKSSIGDSFIEALSGNPWKHVHQMLAPGLTPGAVKTYSSYIVGRAAALHRRFEQLAAAGDVFDIHFQFGKYPTEVIGKVFFGDDFDTDGADEQLYEDLMIAAEHIGFLGTATFTDPLKKWVARRDMNKRVARVNNDIAARVHKRFAELKKLKALPNRSTATNLLDRMLVAQVESGLPIDDALMTLIMDNIRGFLIAGFGTTADTSTYIHIMLQAFPEARQKLREEHERVFGKDLDSTLRMLNENPALLKELPYTDAVIEETLRMYPIGMVCRSAPPEVTTLEHNGQSFPIGNNDIAIVGFIMHWNPEYFPEPSQFWPERHLETSPSDAGNGTAEKQASADGEKGQDGHGHLQRHPKQPPFPRNAFRPFERGLRSCLGRHLAMDEMRVMLLVTARFFDFELVNHEPAEKPALSFTDHDTRIGVHAFQRIRLTAGPGGPGWMKAKLAEATAAARS